MSERTSLEAHVDLCELRYRQLDDRMNRVEQRFDRLDGDVKELKESTGKSLKEIKSLIEVGQHEKFKTMVTVAGTIIVSLIGMLGYLLTHLPK